MKALLQVGSVTKKIILLLLKCIFFSIIKSILRREESFSRASWMEMLQNVLHHESKMTPQCTIRYVGGHFANTFCWDILFHQHRPFSFHMWLVLLQFTTSYEKHTSQYRNTCCLRRYSASWNIPHPNFTLRQSETPCSLRSTSWGVCLQESLAAKCHCHMQSRLLLDYDQNGSETAHECSHRSRTYFHSRNSCNVEPIHRTIICNGLSQWDNVDSCN